MSFEFLQNETKHKGYLIKVGDVWQQEQVAIKIVAIMNGIAWCADERFSEKLYPNFIRHWDEVRVHS